MTTDPLPDNRQTWESVNRSPFIRGILRMVAALLRTESVAVLLLDDAGENLVFCAAEGKLSDKYCGNGSYDGALRVPVSEKIGINPLVVLYGKTICTKQPDPRHNPEIDSIVGTRTMNLCSCPVIGEDQAFGTVSAINVRDGESPPGTDAFTPADVEIMETLAEAVALYLAREEYRDDAAAMRPLSRP